MSEKLTGEETEWLIRLIMERLVEVDSDKRLPKFPEADEYGLGDSIMDKLG